MTADDGPLLILAGAGSGKTRVITHRVAYLIQERHTPPAAIVAVTFTNKAAREMLERLCSLLQVDVLPRWSPAAPRLGTFHGFCLRLLRSDAERLGFSPGFVVYDTDDSRSLMKKCLKELSLDEKVYPPRRVLSRVSEAKDRMVGPDRFLEAAGDHDTETMGQLYRLYQHRLRQSNAMDFDDLIMKTLELFRDHPDRRQFHAASCRHLLVDEFQDTNRSQYRLVQVLASVHGNVFAVGDEDQSIYRFRGADIENILNFEKDYPNAHLIRLEQNYRSTKKILAAASAVVSHNSERLGKTLFSKGDEGEAIKVFRAGTEQDEARWVVERLRAQRDQEDIPLDQQVILYRANFQSRPFEEVLTRSGIPYMLVGSVRFYERREVKDILSYLRLLHNPADDTALTRIINVPARGIGRSTLETLETLRRDRDEPLLATALFATQQGLLSPRQNGSLQRFLAMIEALRQDTQGKTLRTLMEEIIDRTGYLAYLEKVEPVSFQGRVENLEELATAADEDETAGGNIESFLDRTSLTAMTESETGENGVILMTLHCAKGLEFPVVFVVGLEERLFPHSRSMGSVSDIEEERRLFYVGITRAMRRLMFSHVAMRSVYGRMQISEPSRFLSEIPAELLEEEVSEVFNYASLRRGGEARSRTTAAGWSEGAAAARVVSRGGGRGGEVTVEYNDGDTSPDDYTALRPGMQVVHGKYGQGTVLQREGSGQRLKLTVSFRGVGRKKLMARYAGLRIL